MSAIGSDAPPVLRARTVSKAYPGSGRGAKLIKALIDVDITVAQGQTTGVLGESGSGKSTLGRLLLDLERPDSGQIEFDGLALQKLDGAGYRRYRRSVQAVFQNPLRSFNPMWTIGHSIVDAVRMGGDSSGRRDARRRSGELLDSVELGDRFFDRRPSQMSGGELQRAAIARALATEPSVLFLDEPTSSLDVSVRGQVIDVLEEIQARRHLALVWVSHELRVLRATATRIVVMYRGQVVEEGETSSVFDDPKHPYTMALLRHAFRDSSPTGTEQGVVMSERSPTTDDGCLYASRCSFVDIECQASQHLRITDIGHSVRCVRAPLAVVAPAART